MLSFKVLELVCNSIAAPITLYDISFSFIKSFLCEFSVSLIWRSLRGIKVAKTISTPK